MMRLKPLTIINLVTPKTKAKHKLSQTYEGQKSVTMFQRLLSMNLITPKAAAKHDLLFNKLLSGFQMNV